MTTKEQNNNQEETKSDTLFEQSVSDSSLPDKVFEKYYGDENYRKKFNSAEDMLKDLLLKSVQEARKELIKEFEKMIDNNSIPVMDEEEMNKFVEQNSESSVYRIVNFDKFKHQLKQLGDK